MEYKAIELNKEQKDTLKEIMGNQYAKGPFQGMVGNRYADYEMNGTPKTYDECLKQELDHNIIIKLTLEANKKEAVKPVAVATKKTFG